MSLQVAARRPKRRWMFLADPERDGGLWFVETLDSVTLWTFFTEAAMLRESLVFARATVRMFEYGDQDSAQLLLERADEWADLAELVAA